MPVETSYRARRRCRLVKYSRATRAGTVPRLVALLKARLQDNNVGKILWAARCTVRNGVGEADVVKAGHKIAGLFGGLHVL